MKSLNAVRMIETYSVRDQVVRLIHQKQNDHSYWNGQRSKTVIRIVLFVENFDIGYFIMSFLKSNIWETYYISHVIIQYGLRWNLSDVALQKWLLQHIFSFAEISYLSLNMSIL